jgi:hypothetical protein
VILRRFVNLHAAVSITLTLGSNVHYTFSVKKGTKRRLPDFHGERYFLLSPAMGEPSVSEGANGMNRRVTLLATLHELQGAEKRPGNVDDPMYAKLLKQLIIGEGIDFVFEEASGWGPTTAEKLSLGMLGPNRYVDVDPPREERAKFGIPADSNDSYMIGSPPKVAFASWQFHEVQARREEFWIQELTRQEFESGLMVCGLAHGLSFAFRLHAANFSVKALEYANWHRPRA